MPQGWAILLCSFAYLGILFAIAFYGDRRADAGRSIIANPYIYALSMAVYATSWTFYGSVGRAAASGVGFLPIYVGPTLDLGLGGSNKTTTDLGATSTESSVDHTGTDIGVQAGLGLYF